MVEHFYVTIGDHSCNFLDRQMYRQTDRQMPLKTTPVTSDGMGSNNNLDGKYCESTTTRKSEIWGILSPTLATPTTRLLL